MATLRLVASLALITACAPRDPSLYATWPEPIEVEGPPGGDMDREWQSGPPEDGAAEGAIASASVTASADVTAAVSDGEIDATLDGYGEWIYIDGYGEVWRPYTTAVGANFTPYETCGSWVWTEWGWTFACEWDWGWLPFHYGRWGWFDDYWAWVPGYDWSPAWVEWRGGGGYVGWRPLAPIVRDHRSVRGGRGGAPIVRDHRGPIVRDHRSRIARKNDWQWRFAAADDFGKPRIRAHLDRSLAEALRVTRPVGRPPVQAAVQPVKAESIMRARLAFANRGVRDARLHPDRPTRIDPRVGGRIDAAPGRAGARSDRPQRRPAPGFDRSSVYQPTWQTRRPAPASFGASHAPVTTSGNTPIEYTPTTPAPSPPLKAPERFTPAQPPMHQAPPAQPPVYQPPRTPDRYTAPRPPTRAPDRASPPTYTPPTYSPPARAPAPTYSPPARAPAPTYSPPARAPAPTYSPPRSYSPSQSRAPSGGGFSGARSHRR